MRASVGELLSSGLLCLVFFSTLRVASNKKLETENLSQARKQVNRRRCATQCLGCVCLAWGGPNQQV